MVVRVQVCVKFATLSILAVKLSILAVKLSILAVILKKLSILAVIRNEMRNHKGLEYIIEGCYDHKEN